MAKLPDSTLLQRREPQAQRPIIAPQDVGIAERAAEETNRDLVQTADRIAQIGEKIIQRDERVKSTNAWIEFQEKSGEIERNFLAEGKLSDPNSVAEYNRTIINLEKEILGKTDVRDDAKIKLSGLLMGGRQSSVDRVAVAAVNAQKKAAENSFNTNLSTLTVPVHANPANVFQSVRDSDAFIDALSLNEDERLALKKKGRGILYETAINKLIEAGFISNIEGTANDVWDFLQMKDVQVALGPEGQDRVFKRIASLKKEESKPAVVGEGQSLVDPQTGRVIFAGPEKKEKPVAVGEGQVLIDPATGKQIFAGPEKKEKPVAVGEGQVLIDPATGKQIFAGPEKQTELEKAAEAAGLIPGTEEYRQFIRDVKLKPQVSITQKAESAGRSELGKLDAKRVDQLTTNATQAYANLAEIDRMKAALKSGTFRTGSFGEFRANLARLAEFIGAPDELKQQIGSATTADTLDAAASRLAINEVPKLGRTIVSGLQLVRESLPALWRTEEGNNILLEIMERVANREIQMAEISEEIFEQEGTLRAKNNSFLKRLRELERQDPIITDELRNKILNASQKAPKSVAEAIEGFTKKQAETLNIPSGWEFVRIESDGRVRLRNTETGQEKVGPKDGLLKK